MVWLTVASAALLWALNLWHCAECLAICPSPNPSAMNNFHGRCTLITFPFKWHCGGLSRSLISVRILLQAFYCWQTKPRKSPRIFSAWLTADSQQPLLQCFLLNWPLSRKWERQTEKKKERSTLVSQHERGDGREVYQPPWRDLLDWRWAGLSPTSGINCNWLFGDLPDEPYIKVLIIILICNSIMLM